MDFPEQIDHLISEVGATMERGAFCTSWLIITEWTDGNGKVWLEEHRRSDLTAWKRLGLLYYIMDAVGIAEDDDG